MVLLTRKSRRHPHLRVVPISQSLQSNVEAQLRRLFSTFAPGVPGVGLLLMRVVAGTSLIAHGVMRWKLAAAGVSMLEIIAGIPIICGLWTPIAGSLVAALSIWNGISRNGDHWACLFLATIGAALALVGPGAWSIDARLFGWKRVEIRTRKS